MLRTPSIRAGSSSSGRAVEVDEGARRPGREQRRAMVGRAAKSMSTKASSDDRIARSSSTSAQETAG
jgi:hypothetical protein